MNEGAREGRVLRGIGGFYRVVLNNGEVVECTIAGRLKSGANSRILPGDLALVQEIDAARVITEVLPRSSEMVRPPVANVDTCVLVQAVCQPDPVFELMDRVLLLAEHEGVKPIVCWTKADICSSEKQEALAEAYKQTGYHMCFTSVKANVGLSALADLLAGSISILSGPSGVGKSSLLNSLCPGVRRHTRAISERGGRGRHTTRHVELLALPHGGFVADSPGFSSLDLVGIAPRQLSRLYPDFAPYAAHCRFKDCVHRGEPGCAVKQAVGEGHVEEGRYQRYLSFLKEVEENESRRY